MLKLQIVVKYINKRTFIKTWTINSKPSERKRRKTMGLKPVRGMIARLPKQVLLVLGLFIDCEVLAGG